MSFFKRRYEAFSCSKVHGTTMRQTHHTHPFRVRVSYEKHLALLSGQAWLYTPRTTQSTTAFQTSPIARLPGPRQRAHQHLARVQMGLHTDRENVYPSCLPYGIGLSRNAAPKCASCLFVCMLRTLVGVCERDGLARACLRGRTRRRAAFS